MKNLAMLNERATLNWNIYASSLLLAVWQRLGIDSYFISPGYRDAPFIAALQACAGLELVSCFDERAAAYQALGCSKAKGRPAVLLCTSGTAGANYFPAVMEAMMDQVPLIVITADRPFELVHAAAQQVVDQRQIYGRFVKKSLDFPAPGPQLDERAWLAYARDLAQTACSNPAGPVHINLPFQLPLDPIASSDRPTAARRAALEANLSAISPSLWPGESPGLPEMAAGQFCEDLKNLERGLLIIGRLAKPEDREAAFRLQQRLAWPCFADIGSGLKGRCSFEILDLQHPQMLELLESYRPQLVVHLGRRLVSRHFDDFLSRLPPARYWVLSSEQGPQDPGHLPQRLQLDVQLKQLANLPIAQAIAPPASLLEAGVAQLRRQLQELEPKAFNFASVAQTIIQLTPKQGHGLFIGNSTAIRAFDSWCYELEALPEIQANRGVSGIEGLLATAMGLARGSRQPWTVVLGDISLMHDLNSVLGLCELPYPLIVIVVNNAGGRIFETLPLQAHAWVKDPFISTPHPFDFAGLASMAKLSYSLCRDVHEFAAAYETAIHAGQAVLIECGQEPEADRRYQELIRSLRRP